MRGFVSLFPSSRETIAMKMPACDGNFGGGSCSRKMDRSPSDGTTEGATRPLLMANRPQKGLSNGCEGKAGSADKVAAAIVKGIEADASKSREMGGEDPADRPQPQDSGLV
jgi:hypothetical protein